MRSLSVFVAGFAVLLHFIGSAQATSLRVAPVGLDLRAPAAASTIRVWNDARQPISVQIRVFRWSQRNGEDVYEQTNDVVASPPFTTLQPGAENLIRIVRTSNRPVQGEESYRLIVDELPDPARRQAGNITFVVRHVIPVFFATADAPGAEPSWTVTPSRDGYVVTVRNAGAKRLRVSNLTLSAGGAPVARKDGLVGYALGNSTASWFIPGTGQGPADGSVTISADNEAGRFDAVVQLHGG